MLTTQQYLTVWLSDDQGTQIADNVDKPAETDSGNRRGSCALSVEEKAITISHHAYAYSNFIMEML